MSIAIGVSAILVFGALAIAARPARQPAPLRVRDR